MGIKFLKSVIVPILKEMEEEEAKGEGEPSLATIVANANLGRVAPSQFHRSPNLRAALLSEGYCKEEDVSDTLALIQQLTEEAKGSIVL